MQPEQNRAEAIELLDGYIDATIEGFLANARAIEGRPVDRAAGARILASSNSSAS